MTEIDSAQTGKIGFPHKEGIAPSPGPANETFDPVMKAAHWLSLFLIVLVFSTAALLDVVPNAFKLSLLHLHRSFGLMVLIVTLARLAWRQRARLPEWPSSMPKSMRIAAHSTEHLLYALLMLQPVLGLLQTNANGGRVNFFLSLRLPALIGRDDERAEWLHGAHGFAAKALLAVIALHAAAALFHHFIRRDDTLRRMLPKF